MADDISDAVAGIKTLTNEIDKGVDFIAAQVAALPVGGAPEVDEARVAATIRHLYGPMSGGHEPDRLDQG
jgi:hypothetical protein